MIRRVEIRVTVCSQNAIKRKPIKLKNCNLVQETKVARDTFRLNFFKVNVEPNWFNVHIFQIAEAKSPELCRKKPF